MRTSNTLREALRLLSLGVSLLPIQPRSKRPALRVWGHLQQKRPDVDTLTSWFGAGDRNVAVICGAVSEGLAVRDFDDAASYERWAARHTREAKRLPTVRTSQGFHVYFRAGEGLRTRYLGDGELRGDGSYVVAPPSTHESGAVYSWLRAPRSIPVVDADLFLSPECLAGDAERARAYGPQWLVETPYLPVERIVEKCTPTGRGMRERCLWNLARCLKGRLPSATLEELNVVLAQWWRRSEPIVGTKEFAESERCFFRAWDRVRVPAGAGWGAAVELAQGLESSPLIPVGLSPRARRLAGLCLALSEMFCGGSFPLGSRKAGEFLGTSHTLAQPVIRALLDTGFLICTDRATLAGKRARMYRVSVVGTANPTLLPPTRKD